MFGKPKEPLVDMHVHTTASDGGFTPTQIVEEAARIGLAGIAITDHDTTEGYEEARSAGRKLGVRVLPGIEISLEFVNNTHLLGYFPNGYHEGFVASIEKLKQYRQERIPKIIARLAELGCPIEMDEVLTVAGEGQVGRPHIAKVLVDRGYVKTTKEAFDSYLASYASAYVKKKKFDPKEAIDLINNCGGIPVLAHPITMEMDMRYLHDQIRAWKTMGLKGLEVYYSEYSKDQEATMQSISEQEGMLKTGGSDFHGPTKPDISLGKGKGKLKIPWACFQGILDFQPESR